MMVQLWSINAIFWRKNMWMVLQLIIARDFKDEQHSIERVLVPIVVP